MAVSREEIGKIANQAARSASKCESYTELTKCKCCEKEFPRCQMIYISTKKEFWCHSCYNSEFYQKPYQEQMRYWKERRRELTPLERTMRDLVMKMLYDEKERYCDDIAHLCKLGWDDEYFHKRLDETERQIKKITALEDLPLEKKFNTVRDWFDYIERKASQ